MRCYRDAKRGLKFRCDPEIYVDYVLSVASTAVRNITNCSCSSGYRVNNDLACGFGLPYGLMHACVLGCVNHSKIKWIAMKKSWETASGEHSWHTSWMPE